MVVPLEGLDLGDGTVEPVVDGEEIEAALFPGLTESGPDGSGWFLQLVVLPVTATPSRSTSRPDHLESLDIFLPPAYL